MPDPTHSELAPMCRPWATVVLACCASAVLCCAGPMSRSVQLPFRGIAGPVIIAHRGGALEVPENTMAGIEHARSVGADWVEIDVRVSKDGEVIVMHDETVDRTTNGTGRVASMRASDVLALEAGAPRFAPDTGSALMARGLPIPDFAGRFPEQRVPSLERALTIPELRFMVEVKSSGEEPRDIARAVLGAMQNARATDRCAIGSFSPEVLWAVYDADPTVPLIGIAEDAAGVQAMLNLPIMVLAISEDLLTQAQAQRPTGLALWVWTVYRAQDAEKLEKAGVHGVITDVPRAVVETLRPPPKLYIEPSEGG